jgi:hypothetical protein
MYKQNKINKMTQEKLRMQMLAGVITESQYKTKLNEAEDVDAKIAQLQAQIALLQKQKETGGKIPLTPEQKAAWEKRNKELYKETQAGKNDYFADDFPGLSAQVLIYILNPKERNEEKAAQKLGFEDYQEFESEVSKMLDKMGYEWWD